MSIEEECNISEPHYISTYDMIARPCLASAYNDDDDDDKLIRIWRTSGGDDDDGWVDVADIDPSMRYSPSTCCYIFSAVCRWP